MNVIFVVLVMVFIFKDVHADPCSSYTLISGQYQRSTAYKLKDTDIAISDNFLSEGWFRFDSGAGNDMVTEAPQITQCGTIYPIWLQGTLPSDADGEVSRTACIVGFSGTCSKTLNIRIKSCGGHRIYYLLPAPQTSTGYCIGNETLCPKGQSSDTGFTPCQELYGRISVPIHTHYLPSINTNPAVNVSLEIKQTNSTQFTPMEPVFKCLFDEPSGSPYWYDTYWYINADIVKVVESQLYQYNQSWLYPKDWVDKYDLNMVVKCSVRVRHFERSIPGHHNYSENFQAGMFPSSFSHGIREGETISIKLTVTVPVGCFDLKLQKHCKTNIFILTPEYQTSIGTCQNYSGQGEVSFQEKRCGIVIESSTWWEEKILNVTGKTDGLINIKERNVYIKLGSITESVEDTSGVWYNFSMPDIQIFLYDEDKKLENKVCTARTDPRIGTFDGRYWTTPLSGEFVMYRDDRRKIAVHALFSTCNMEIFFRGWFPPCICGIAVRVENSLYVYRTCRKISNHYAKSIIYHHNVNQICDNRHMVVEIGNPVTKITLPNGAIVTFAKNFYWIYRIHVTPSIFDEDSVRGLCGNPNNDKTDDFTIQGSSFIAGNEREFQASWGVDIISKDSLFGNNTELNSTVSELQKYCDCATEQQSVINTISSYYTTNCSIATEMVLCSEKTTAQSMTSTCEQYQNRYKRAVNQIDFEHHTKKRSIDNDDTMESQPLTIDPNFDPNFVPPTPSWRNNWTEPTALEHCKNIILNNRGRIECAKYIPMENHTNAAIEECVLDIRDSGSTDFSKYTIESLNEYCLEQIKKYEIFHMKNGSGALSVVETIGKLVCPNDCSSNGVCNEGTCTCSFSYVGHDCSHAKSTPPSNLSLPDDGLCKKTKRSCKETHIFGYFQSDTVYVKFEELEITNSGTIATSSPIVLQPTFISLTILKINLPNTRSKRSTLLDSSGRAFNINLSYDAVHFSEALTLVIFNDACYSCSAIPLECNTTVTSLCLETTTEVNTVNQSSSSDGKNDKFPGGSIFIYEKENESKKRLNIVYVSIPTIVITIIIIVAVYQKKVKPKRQLSPFYKDNVKKEVYFESFEDQQSSDLVCGKPPVQHSATTKYDRHHSPPPKYESTGTSISIITL